MCNLNWVTIKKFSEISGYSIGAIEKKIERKQWKEFTQWIRAPDGRIQISIDEIEKWYQSGLNRKTA